MPKPTRHPTATRRRPAPRPFGGEISYGTGSSSTTVPRLLPNGQPNPLYQGLGGYGSVPKGQTWATSTTPTSTTSYNPSKLVPKGPLKPFTAPPIKPTPVAPLPQDAAFTGDLANLYQRAGLAKAKIARNRTDLNLAYGYNPTYDSNGLVTALAEDPSNPFSKAALLRQTYRNARTDTANTGQMYAGSSIKRLGNVNDAENQASYGLRQSYTQAQNALTDQYNNVGQAAGESYQTAYQNLIARHANDVPVVPKPPQQPTAAAPHVNPSGPRAGQRYTIVTVKGRKYHRYRNPVTNQLYLVKA